MRKALVPLLTAARANFLKAALQRLVDEHLQGQRIRRLLIWSLLNLEWWIRSYLSVNYPNFAW